MSLASRSIPLSRALVLALVVVAVALAVALVAAVLLGAPHASHLIHGAGQLAGGPGGPATNCPGGASTNCG